MVIGIDRSSGPDCSAITVACAGRMVVMGVLPPGCQMLGMAVFRGELIVATDQGIYVSRDGVLEKLPPAFGT